ncbi:MAG: hypothetical protein ACI865_002992 [Flavobacteriaceae bacterium]
MTQVFTFINGKNKLMSQITNKVLMMAPTQFGFNDETSASNSFQNEPPTNEVHQIQERASAEFKHFVDKLSTIGIEVLVYQDEQYSQSPDSIFPNNWFSTHISGELIIYPMAAINRRNERRSDIISDLISKEGYHLKDLTRWEEMKPSFFLEGTGSIVFDHDDRIIYAAISTRTFKEPLKELASEIGYSICDFQAIGKAGEPIYHTNVMMCVGKTFVAIGVDTIAQGRERTLAKIHATEKEVISLSNEQVYHSFAGNMLQLENYLGETVLVVSTAAFNSFSDQQLSKLNDHNDHILPISIPTIEKIGGGSVRCMLAEIFSIKKEETLMSPLLPVS